MKKLNVFKTIAFCCLLYIGCQSPKTDETKNCKQEVDSLKNALSNLQQRQANPAVSDWCNQGTVRSKPEQYIDFAQAAAYAWDYTDNFQLLATNEGGWMEITKDQILGGQSTDKLLTERCGLLAYFIYEDNTFKLAWKLASAFDDEFDPFPVPIAEDNVEYKISVCHNKYLTTDLSSSRNLIDALLRYYKKCTETPKIILGKYIGSKAQAFKEKINTKKPDSVDDPVGFFHSVQIINLLDQTKCRGLRIYWGYDSNAAENKIKLVAFGIADDGKNLPIDNKILQRSWPPY